MATKKVGIISQARMTSTRLPGKVLLQAGGMGGHQRRAREQLQHFAGTRLDRLLAGALGLCLAAVTLKSEGAGGQARPVSSLVHPRV